jgi:cytidylate kinase
LHRNVVESIDGHRRSEMLRLFDSILNNKVDDTLVVRKLAEVIRSLAIHGHAVLVGRGSWLVTQDLKTALHVRLVAPRGWRVYKIASTRELTHDEAEALVSRREKEREQFLKTYFVQDPAHPFYHDLVLDNARFNLDQMVEIILCALAARFGEQLIGA